MDTNNIDVVRAIVKAARPSDAKRAPPRKPQKPPPALQRAAALVRVAVRSGRVQASEGAEVLELLLQLW